MKFCAHVGCEEKTYYLIVYGCLNYHIRELIYCFHHGEEWASEQHNRTVKCSQCQQPIEEYEFKWIDKKGAIWQ